MEFKKLFFIVLVCFICSILYSKEINKKPQQKSSSKIEKSSSGIELKSSKYKLTINMVQPQQNIFEKEIILKSSNYQLIPIISKPESQKFELKSKSYRLMPLTTSFFVK